VARAVAACRVVAPSVWFVSLLLALGTLGACPGPGEAQPAERTWRIGYLSMGSPDVDQAWVAAFRRGLHELGYVEGRNMVVEHRHAAGRSEALPGLLADLVRLKVAVLVVWGDVAMQAAREVAPRLPIVMAVHPDPVGAGLVASLARPGGQVTGLSDYHGGTITKRIELLKEVLPGTTKVAVLFNPGYPAASRQLAGIQADAQVLGVTLVAVEARGDAGVSQAFTAIARERAGGLLIIPDPTFTARRRIADLAIRNRLSSVSTVRQWAEAGVLMSYGTSFTHLWHRAATYVDKILKGAQPGDLPVEQATKFELVINLRTARALGLTVPPALLLRADEVIE
jgi:putative ABC transport system substrate-binding protein